MIPARIRLIRSAEHAVALYLAAVERTTSTRAINPGERVRRPKGLSCPKCESRRWKLGKGGQIVCGGAKCKKVWPSEYVSDAPQHGPRARPPAEGSLLLRADLALVLATSRRTPSEPPPMTTWQRVVLFTHAELGSGIPGDVADWIERMREAPRGRIELLVAALRTRYPGARYSWDRWTVRRLLCGAEQRVEARLRWRGLLA